VRSPGSFQRGRRLLLPRWKGDAAEDGRRARRTSAALASERSEAERELKATHDAEVEAKAKSDARAALPRAPSIASHAHSIPCLAS